MIEVMDTVGVLTLGFAAGMTVGAGLTFRVLWGPEKVPAETGADEFDGAEAGLSLACDGDAASRAPWLREGLWVLPGGEIASFQGRMRANG
jgi:hypothetical protein